jgi:AraC family transcriptional regulator
MALLANNLNIPACSVIDSSVINFPAPELLRMFEDARQALAANPERAPQITMGFVRRIVSSPATEPAHARGGLAPWQKRKIERYLQDNLEHNICMEELAKEARLSISHFCRAFKKSFSETPHAYVIRLRLELARKLMLSTNEPLSQIALSCGLADQAHLSKLFRRVFHDTPNAWRRRNLTELNVSSRRQNTSNVIRDAA